MLKRALVFGGTTAAGVFLLAGSAFAASGSQGFTLMGQHVTASGPIHGTGVDQPVTDSRDLFVFHQGTVNVDHAATAQHPGLQAGCTFFYSERGTYQLAGGTGQYTGASGGGTYALNDTFFGQRLPNGTCSDTAGHDLLTVFAHGHTTLPS